MREMDALASPGGARSGGSSVARPPSTKSGAIATIIAVSSTPACPEMVPG